jgi:hypothetical protein
MEIMKIVFDIQRVCAHFVNRWKHTLQSTGTNVGKTSIPTTYTYTHRPK